MMVHTALRAPDGHEVLLAGGILGLAEEAPRLVHLLESRRVDRILLGIPFEDLDAIKATRDAPRASQFERDGVDEAYLRMLSRYGPVQVPPGDLYAAYDHAARHDVPVEAIDLGDEGHSTTWAEHVGLFELMRNNRRLRRLGEMDLQAETAQEFATAWDRAIFPSKGLRRVQADREAWMGRRIREYARTERTVFALVPLARMAGIRDHLVREGGFHEANG